MENMRQCTSYRRVCMRRKKIEFFCEVNGNKNELHKYRKKKYNNTQKYMVSREGGINVLLFNSEWYYNDAPVSYTHLTLPTN